MAPGLPIVATNTGGIPEIVSHGQNELLVEPNDLVVQAESIGYLLGSEGETIRKGKSGHDLAIKLNQDVVTKPESAYLEIA